MTVSVLADLHVRSSSFACSDLKTLLASAWCFAHGEDAYSLPNLQHVFAAQGVVLPASWFAHAPVYPPLSLALLAPLTWIPMVTVAYLVVVVSSALFALAVAALVEQAAEDGLPLSSRLAIAGVSACCPLLGFALSMGNVSVAASALCILAFVRRHRGTGWLYGSLLAIAVLLKPHLALWMLTGMLMLPDRASRAVALRAAGIAAAFAACSGIALLSSRHFLMQVRGFVAMVWSETAHGSSMSSTSHEVSPIVAQVTSLHSVVGFWWPQSLVVTLLTFAALAALGLYIARRIGATWDRTRMSAIVGAWMSFGLLATYHRAHDALALLVMVPWWVRSIRGSIRCVSTWAIALPFAALNLSVPYEWLSAHIAGGEVNHAVAFLLLRQAAFADLGLLAMLLFALHDAAVVRQILPASRRPAPTRHAISAS